MCLSFPRHVSLLLQVSLGIPGIPLLLATCCRPLLPPLKHLARALTERRGRSPELTYCTHSARPIMFLPSPISTYYLITMNQQFLLISSQVSWSLLFHQILALILLNQHMSIKKKGWCISFRRRRQCLLNTAHRRQRWTHTGKDY